jgi:hypothetical protein
MHIHDSGLGIQTQADMVVVWHVTYRFATPIGVGEHMYFFDATHTSVNAAQHHTSTVSAVDQQVAKRHKTTAQHGGSPAVAAAGQDVPPPPEQVCNGDVIHCLFPPNGSSQ